MDLRIDEVINYIRQHLNQPFVLKDLAKRAFMSPSHFHRTFKQATGKTPFHFIVEAKMQAASEAMLSDGPSVQYLSDQLGYRDYETFSRAFKKHFGVAPDDYKAIALKIKSSMSEAPKAIILKRYEDDDLIDIKRALEEVIQQLKDFLAKEGYSYEELKAAKLVSVMPKDFTEHAEHDLVRNKFAVVENQEIWEQILNHFSDGGN